MPQVKETPLQLKVFTFHGVDLDWSGTTDQAHGDCPLCGREEKFIVNKENGKWDCKKCGATGNPLTFLRQLYRMSFDTTTDSDYEELAADRKFNDVETLRAWGVAKSCSTGEWLVPGYNLGGEVSQLYRYVQPRVGKRLLMVTPEMPLLPMGLGTWDVKKQFVYVCESWNGMILWETLRHCKPTTDGLALTSSLDASLYHDANVIAVSGCGAIGKAMERWASLFGGKTVCLMFDNDHPRKHPQTGAMVEPAGFGACKRATTILANAEHKPEEVQYLFWGDDGYDPELQSGYDVRDILTSGDTTKERIGFLQLLLDRIVPIPSNWATFGGEGGTNGSVELALAACSEWKDVQTSCRKAMKWIEGLDRGLSVALACILSTELVGDQLWIKLIGPPSCGKSVICEALSTNKQYITAKSTIRGFHSGFKTDQEGKEDNSLIALIKNKTLVTKDGDTLLQAPNLSQILSEARDIYDRVSRTHYRNRMSKDYIGYNMTWILCGTSSLRALDDSELGERFLDCVMVEDMDEDIEDEIGWRVAKRAEREMSLISDGKAETRDGPEMVEMKRLVGGYIQWLRDNASVLIGQVEFSDDYLRRCQKFAKFVAYFRARPSKKQKERVEREMSFRLTSQLIRLSKCLAVVLNRSEVDKEVIRRTRLVAFDTCRGRTLEIGKYLFQAGEVGAPVAALSKYTGHSEEEEGGLLKFLRKIGVVERFEKQIVNGVKGPIRWRLTEKMRKLWEEVTNDD